MSSSESLTIWIARPLNTTKQYEVRYAWTSQEIPKTINGIPLEVHVNGDGRNRGSIEMALNDISPDENPSQLCRKIHAVLKPFGLP